MLATRPTLEHRGNPINRTCDGREPLRVRFFYWMSVMRKQMTFEQANAVLNYDPLTGVLTWKVGRPKAKAGAVVGNVMTTQDGKKYLQFMALGTMYLVHRVVFLLMTGDFPPEEVDHRDGNGLNNVWTNLRAVSRTENARNHKRSKHNTSGCRGVGKTRNGWWAYIYVNRRRISVGHFRDKEEAIAARKKAERDLGYHQNHGSDRPL